MTPKCFSLFAILAFASCPVGAQQAAQNTPPRTVNAPVTVVVPASESSDKLTPTERDAPVRVVQDGPVRVVQSGPVAFTFPLAIWIAWLVSIATGLGAVTVIWRYATKAAKIVSDFTEYKSVLLDIAKEFKSDSGSTLKDSINRIELATGSAQASATLAKTMADNLEKMLRDHMALAEAREEIRHDEPPSKRRSSHS